MGIFFSVLLGWLMGEWVFVGVWVFEGVLEIIVIDVNSVKVIYKLRDVEFFECVFVVEIVLNISIVFG